MIIKNKHIFCFILIICVTIKHGSCDCSRNFSRKSFPQGFVFGTASSAFQYEGAVKEDGRGPSIWDKFTHAFGKIIDFSNADVANDHYHRYREDIGLLKDLGVDAYRFSISWTRIFPSGSGEINQAGIDHYNNLINTLLDNGIEPYVTMFHFDTPQGLDDKYQSWLNPQIIEDFGSYAEVLYEKFGDRVKHWITINEPHTVAIQGYDTGIFAPGRCSILFHVTCKEGNSLTEPYIVAHHLLLAHATAVYIYRNKYQKSQGGTIGAAFNVFWFEPATNKTKDIEATQRAQDFQLGWFLDPLMFGDYPMSMKQRVGDRLPKFTASESALLKGSLDFVGINHYTTYYARENTTQFIGFLLNDAQSDAGAVTLPFGANFKPIGEKAHNVWLYVVPRGMRELMNYIKIKYNNPTVFITENGYDDGNNPFKSRSKALKDEKRIQYFNGYLENLAAAVNEDNCNVKGHFSWSFLDNFEWSFGYTSRYGLYYVDYRDKQKRYPKNSVQWFKNFLNSTC